MWIRILDPHWKKMYPDLDPSQKHFFKIYWIFFTKHNCQFIFFFFSLSFMLEHKRFRDQEFVLIFFLQQFRFWLFAYLGWYFAPWFRWYDIIWIAMFKVCQDKTEQNQEKNQLKPLYKTKHCIMKLKDGLLILKETYPL